MFFMLMFSAVRLGSNVYKQWCSPERDSVAHIFMTSITSHQAFMHFGVLWTGSVSHEGLHRNFFLHNPGQQFCLYIGHP